MRHRNRSDMLESDLPPRALQERREGSQVLARRQVGHDTAVFFVQGDLAVHPFAGQSAPRIENGHGRLVARALQREDHRTVDTRRTSASPKIRTPLSTSTA